MTYSRSFLHSCPSWSSKSVCAVKSSVTNYCVCSLDFARNLKWGKWELLCNPATINQLEIHSTSYQQHNIITKSSSVRNQLVSEINFDRNSLFIDFWTFILIIPNEFHKRNLANLILYTIFAEMKCLKQQKVMIFKFYFLLSTHFIFYHIWEVLTVMSTDSLPNVSLLLLTCICLWNKK
jgi:hypothetical protein